MSIKSIQHNTLSQCKHHSEQKQEAANHNIEFNFTKTDFTPNYSIISNNSTKQAWRQLIIFKCIITQQLPKMPKEYITRLLFDRKHFSLILKKPNGQTIGGICFRVFDSKTFVELVFMAIGRHFKNQGFGTKLLTYFKDYLQTKDINLILTYADNTATGFFRKQGFEPTIESPDKVWSGYIKEYLEGTLMECAILHNIKRGQLRKQIAKQKAELVRKTCHLYKWKYSRYDGRIIEQLKKKYPLKEIMKRVPGVYDNWWCAEREYKLQSKPQISRLLMQFTVLAKLRELPSGYLFRGLEPVPLKDQFKATRLIDIPTLEKKIMNMDKNYSHEKLGKWIMTMVKEYVEALLPTSSAYEDAKTMQAQMNVLLRQLLEGRVKVVVPKMFSQTTNAIKWRKL